MAWASRLLRRERHGHARHMATRVDHGLLHRHVVVGHVHRVGAPVAVDGVRILQHEQRHCAGCRLELTRVEDPAVGCADDGCWTAVSVVKGPAIYLSTRQQLVRHVRLKATEDAPNTRWHVKDIVIYGAASGGEPAPPAEPETCAPRRL